jgi:FAD/FMN-containing dehydrogenase
VLRAERILGFDAAPTDASLAALDVLTATSDARVGLLDDPAFEGSLASRFPAQLPDGVDLMRGLRRTLDPDGVLSPRSTLAD